MQLHNTIAVFTIDTIQGTAAITNTQCNSPCTYVTTAYRPCQEDTSTSTRMILQHLQDMQRAMKLMMTTCYHK